VFELGSVIKAVTFAMAFDYGVTDLNGRYDASAPLVIGHARISDFHALRRVLSVPEIFINSSNIGTAKMALEVGIERHQAFLRRVGLFDRLLTEVPETARPLLPVRWGRLVTATAAFGHGFAVQPLQGASVVAGLLNGGELIPPTFIKRGRAEAESLGRRVIKPKTSEMLRYLFRLNVEKGTAEKANVLGYRVGGKTGTAEKVVNGRYSHDRRLSTFIGAFPMENPRYFLMVLLDEPQALPETFGFATAGWNAVPTASKIIERIAPMLGIAPREARQAGGAREETLDERPSLAPSFGICRAAFGCGRSSDHWIDRRQQGSETGLSVRSTPGHRSRWREIHSSSSGGGSGGDHCQPVREGRRHRDSDP
jgi:cell division protein FtsI (penicillin-binding protein 3)